MASLCVVTIFQDNPGSAGGVDPVAAKQVVFYFHLDCQGYLLVAIVVVLYRMTSSFASVSLIIQLTLI